MRFRWRLMAALVAGVHATGCTLIVDTSTRTRCTSDGDCGDGDCVDGVCSVALPAAACSTNADCRGDAGKSYCVNRRCIDDPISLECPEVWPAGALERNGGNKLLIGFLGAVGGSRAPSDAGSAASYGTPPLEGVKLALTEIENNHNGLPASDSEGQRHLSMLICDEEAGNAAASAEHLVRAAQVPLIIGASFSGNTLRVFDEVTKNAGVLLLSPSATSPAVSERTRHDQPEDDPDDLLWRTSPSDVAQAELLKFLIGDVERALGLSEPELVLTVKGDPAGTGLQRAMTTPFAQSPSPAPALSEASPRVHLMSYPEVPPGDAAYWTGRATALVKLQPRLVLALGTLEFVEYLLPQIEALWPPGVARPWYLLPEGCKGEALAGYDQQHRELALSERVVGTAPGARKSPEYAGFAARFRGLFEQREPGNLAEFGYDAAYLVAYAIAASQRAFPGGVELGQALGRLACPDPGGAVLVPGPSDFARQFELAASGGCLNFDGASGPLDFDGDGEVLSDIATWCLRQQGALTLLDPPLDYYYSAQTQSLAGPVPDFGSAGWCNAALAP